MRYFSGGGLRLEQLIEIFEVALVALDFRAEQIELRLAAVGGAHVKFGLAGF